MSRCLDLAHIVHHYCLLSRRPFRNKPGEPQSQDAAENKENCPQPAELQRQSTIYRWLRCVSEVQNLYFVLRLPVFEHYSNLYYQIQRLYQELLLYYIIKFVITLLTISMGNNPTKSQQLSVTFPEFKILPQLSLHPSNSYELIYVANQKTNQIFIIKESNQENVVPIDVQRCPNVLACFQRRRIDNMFYSLYEWIPMTLDRFMSTYPQLLTPNFATFILQTLLRTYCLLWKCCDGLGLDIDVDNIRARDNSGRLELKVFPHNITHCPLSQRKIVYRNQIKHLGEAISKLFVGKQKLVGEDVLRFVNFHMKQTSNNSFAIWQSLYHQSLKLSQLPSISARELNDLKYPQAATRPYSPLTSQRASEPFVRVIVGNAGFSPFSTSRVAQKRDLSPQVSRLDVDKHVKVVTFNSRQDLANQGRPPTTTISPMKRAELLTNTSPYPQAFKVGQPIPKQGQKQNCVALPKVLHQQNQPTVLHQNYFPNPSSTPKTFSEPKNFQANSQLQLDGSIISPIRYYGGAKEQRTRTTSVGPIVPSIEQVQKQVKVVEKNLSNAPIFEPLARDPLQIRPKLGVPSNTFDFKTCEDRYGSEENGQSAQSSLNLQQATSNFIQKHLLVKSNRNMEELLGSSIPIADKLSSFGLTVSDDSIQANEQEVYEGIYEGSFHPKFKTTRHGSGRLLFPSGGSYQGGFAWNKMEGWGKLFYASGRLAYEGYWKDNKFDGYGKLFNEKPLHIEAFDCSDFNRVKMGTDDGYWKYYEGNMKNDMKEGHGIWVLENGEKYEGQFHKDMVHGFGTFYGKNECIEGQWRNNLLIEIVKRI